MVLWTHHIEWRKPSFDARQFNCRRSSQLWNECYGAKEKVFDYAGRLMLKCACGNPHSAYQPTVDHIRPIAGGGKDIKANMIICHRSTKEEKADRFPHWKANGSRFHAKKAKGVKNGYRIVNEERHA